VTRSALLCGTLAHARDDRHARRAFRYPVYMAAIELAELPALHRELRLFSHDAFNVLALHDRDYQHGRADLAALRRVHGLPPPATSVLVTNPRVLGYTFNPVSFVLDYDADGALASVIAEVNNTYGGRRRYALGPAQRLAASTPARVGFRHPRELFVSPFLHGEVDYDFWFDAPLAGDRLAITMHVVAAGSGSTDGGRRVFTAQLSTERRPFTDREIARAALRYPLMTLQVIGLIHYQALLLRWRGVPYRRPGPDHRPVRAPASIVTM
jgi:DUF1365 family protein